MDRDNGEATPYIAIHYDSAEVSMHPDCVAYSEGLNLVALACYELKKEKSMRGDEKTGQEREGCIYFYKVVSIDEGDVREGVERSKGVYGGDVCESWKLERLNVRVTVSSATALKGDCYKIGSAGVLEVKWWEKGLDYDDFSSWLYVSLSSGVVEVWTVSLGDEVVNMTLTKELRGDRNESYECQAKNRIDTSELDRNDMSLTLDVNRLVVSGFRSGDIHVWNDDHLPIWSCNRAHECEIWGVSWLDNSCEANFFVSGSDDCSFKVWDIRRSPFSGPAMQNKTYYQAGVTSFAIPSSSRDGRSESAGALATSNESLNLAVGSYDQTVAIWDLRNVSKTPVVSRDLGGGVWKLKFLNPQRNGPLGVNDCLVQTSLEHEQALQTRLLTGHKNAENNRSLSKNSVIFSSIASAALDDSDQLARPFPTTSSLLAASCMGNGFQVLQPDLAKGAISILTRYYPRSYLSAPSLAYGIDWVRLRHVRGAPRRESEGMVALVSCTFYDNTISLWAIKDSQET